MRDPSEGVAKEPGMFIHTARVPLIFLPLNLGLARFILLGALCWLFLTLIVSVSAQASELVVGEVVDALGEKVPDAVVAIEGVGSTRTDALGRFRFMNVPAGNYRINVSKEGFRTESRHLRVMAGRKNFVTIALSGSGPPSPPPYSGPDIVVPIEKQGKAIYVKAILNGHLQAIFLVDTGATLTTVSHLVAERLGIALGPTVPEVTLQTASGLVQAPLIKIPSVEVGQAEAKDVAAVVLDIPGMPPQVAGLLGLSFLSRFKVTIDPDKELMTLGRP